MRKPVEQLYVEIFDWPDRFLVESDGPDTDYPRVFGIPDPDDETPYLVDLSEFTCGWCGCTDFRIHILPSAERGAVGGYLECKHILAARDFKAKMGTESPKRYSKLSFMDSVVEGTIIERAEEAGGIVDDTGGSANDASPESKL